MSEGSNNPPCFYARIDVRPDGSQTFQLRWIPGAGWFENGPDPADAQSEAASQDDGTQPDGAGRGDEEQEMDEDTVVVAPKTSKKRRAEDDKQEVAGVSQPTGEQDAARNAHSTQSRAQIGSTKRPRTQDFMAEVPLSKDEDITPKNMRGRGVWGSYSQVPINKDQAELEKRHADVDTSNVVVGARRSVTKSQLVGVHPDVTGRRQSLRPLKSLRTTRESIRARSWERKMFPNLGNASLMQVEQPQLEECHKSKSRLSSATKRAPKKVSRENDKSEAETADVAKRRSFNHDLGDELFEAHGCALSDGDVNEEVDHGNDLTEE